VRTRSTLKRLSHRSGNHGGVEGWTGKREK
jgi:hypothetical protein